MNFPDLFSDDFVSKFCVVLMCCVFSHQTQMLKRHNREIEVVFALENFWPQNEGE